MDPTELLALALARLADAVGDLLRDGRDPSTYVLTAAPTDSPIGEVLLEGEGARTEDAVCIMLPVDTLARILEAHAFDEAAERRMADWLAIVPGKGRYRVVAIGRAGIAAITVETDDEGSDEEDGDAPASLLLH
jgi:hypothetical protein